MKIRVGSAFVVCVLACAILSTSAESVCARPAVNLFDCEIEDVKKFSQRPSDYLKSSFRRRWIDEKVQKDLAEAAILMFLSPWTAGTNADAIDSSWGDGVFKNPRWGANLTRIAQAEIDALYEESDMASFPSMKRFAIMVADSDCRLMPTENPAFANPGGAGEGFPFDYLQNSRFRVGAPVLVRHESKSGQWFLVEGAYFSGWVNRRDVAFVNASFMRKYDVGDYAAITSDGTSLRDEKGRFICVADVGSLFPIAESRADGTLVLNVPARTDKGAAKLVRAVVLNGAEKFPLVFNAMKVSQIADALSDTKYGWGGLYGNRDCSQLMQELYMPFGIPLPRNSAWQREAFPSLDVSRLSAKDKIAAIRKYGVPFRTLLGFKGHIGVYVGTKGGEPLLMHCAWGVRLAGENGVKGRLILGRTVITTLSPGKEVPQVVKNSLLDRLVAIVALPGAGSRF